MSTADRRQRHRASLRREILEAATRLLAEEGPSRVTMRRVAGRIEYSPTTIYLYFKNKNELLAAVCEDAFSELAGKLERMSKTAATPRGFLREGLRTYVEFGLAHPAQYAMAFMSSDPGQAGAPEHSPGSRVFDALREGVRACVESGDIQASNVDMTAEALWASVHGLTSIFLTTPAVPTVPKPALVEHLVDTLLAGLKAPVAAPRIPAPPQSKKWNFYD